MTGYRNTNALIAMILGKQAKISAATNKQFTSGEMINFVQVDCNKLVWMIGYLSEVTTFPFILIFNTIILFYYLGWAFMTAIFIFAVTFGINYYVGKRMAKFWGI